MVKIMKFYNVNKTFIESMQGYSGNFDEALKIFLDEWSLAQAGSDTRTLSEALGVSAKDMIATLDGIMSAKTLVEKYSKESAASLKG